MRETSFQATSRSGPVSARLDRPEGARWVYVCAHGAGAGMRHRFMDAITERLVARRIAVFRYQFPYMEAERKRPDPPAVIEATVRSAVRAAAEAVPDLPLVAGGKSMGGRLSSSAQAKDPLPGVTGLVFLGFPLHAAGRPTDERAAHLTDVSLPMLFLQGTRDGLADLGLFRPVLRRLGSRATLHVVDGADHSFHVLKRSGRTDEEVLDELAGAIERWTGANHIPG